mmetsp:Transcript_88525/g.222885  ORF Transcript_88525/g.222885 Transcript_88525/m.222885 type:complete len:601 (+) Transcript_88525:74-1876(+)
MPDPLDSMQQVLSTLRKHDRSGDGTIGMDELQRLLTALDSSGFWSEDKVKMVMDVVGVNRQTGRIGLDQFIHSLYGAQTYDKVRASLKNMMDSPDWDDGSYAPILIRLAWHSSGTYCAADGTGGSNGATMRHALEAGDPENAGLDKPREYLETIKALHPWISYADLWILAACVAIEHTAGPVVPFTGGRTDGPAEKAISPGRLPGAEKGIADGFELDDEGRLKGWENLAQHVRDVFGRMGFSDKEAVALICGGHVYGRCHTGSSGYAGAWVENPTRFSNEYAADMIGDKWIAVMHDTKMPDGGPVPDEVRPAPGKRQYIDLSKYMPEDEEEQQAARTAPDAAGYPPGRYRCVSQWVNCREKPDVSSDIVGRFNQDDVLSLVSVKVFGTAVRGLAERGGWVSIIGSAGKTLFQREGDLDTQMLRGRYRAVAPGGAPFVSRLDAGESTGRTQAGEEFCVGEVAFGQDGQQAGAILGKRADPGAGEGSWIVLHSPSSGLMCELIVQGYNEKPRKAIVGQTGHQMMLVSDMVLLWDKDFREHLQVYAEDEEQLKKDFGIAFQRLTELGCPWSKDFGPMSGTAAAAAMPASGCPFLAGAPSPQQN